jgi:hypothetical protein
MPPRRATSVAALLVVVFAALGSMSAGVLPAVVLTVVVLLALGDGLAYRTRLGGTLSPACSSPAVALLDPRARVWLRLTDWPAVGEYLEPGGDPVTICGVDMTYARGGTWPQERG